MILREPAGVLDARMRTVWAVQGAIATAVLCAGVAVAVVVLARTGAGSTAWLVGGAGSSQARSTPLATTAGTSATR